MLWNKRNEISLQRDRMEYSVPSWFPLNTVARRSSACVDSLRHQAAILNYPDLKENQTSESGPLIRPVTKSYAGPSDGLTSSNVRMFEG